MRKIILTGGGTAGHVTPNLALVPYLKKEDFEIYYIGSENGIEKELIKPTGIPYYEVSTGKLRRSKYLSKQNINDMKKVWKGIRQAKAIMKKIKPDIVFSKGGYVAVPVVLAAKACRVPVVIHESDITPGLANKISAPSAKMICTTFYETLEFIDSDRCVHTGTPLRRQLFRGIKQRGLLTCKFNDKKPVLMVMGGSQGSEKINKVLVLTLFDLLDTFQIVHICGKGNEREELNSMKGYYQIPYVHEGLENLFAMADVVVSRAGSNSICELLALKKPNLLIPLSAEVSRGDQILNAASFEEQGFSVVLQEEDLIAPHFVDKVMEVYENRNNFIQNMRRSDLEKGSEKVMEQIMRFCKTPVGMPETNENND